MKSYYFYNGKFVHTNKNFKNCVNTMTTNIFSSIFFKKCTYTDAIKLEADKMPKGLKQFYADLFMLTTLKRARHVYDSNVNRSLFEFTRYYQWLF